MHLNSLLCFRKHCLPLFHSGVKVLELGPSRRSSFKSEWERAGVQDVDYWTADVRAKHEHVHGLVPMLDGSTLDCAPAMFDIAFSASVLEHVERPWSWIEEQARVVKPGGYVMVIAPFSWEEHRIRTPKGRRDCWRILPDGLRVLFRYSSRKLEPLVCCLESLDKSGSNLRQQLGRVDPIDIVGVAQRIQT